MAKRRSAEVILQEQLDRLKDGRYSCSAACREVLNLAPGYSSLDVLQSLHRRLHGDDVAQDRRLLVQVVTAAWVLLRGLLSNQVGSR